jgi:hypothetical protein
MHRAFVGSAVAILVAALVAAGIAPVLAKTTITPAERCNRLSRQVDEAIYANSKSTQVNAARTLQKRAILLCAQNKRAQGIRTFAKALKLLGAKPADID